jgi:hypothetical protein
VAHGGLLLYVARYRVLIYQRKKTKENTASRIFASRKWSRELSAGARGEDSVRVPVVRAAANTRAAALLCLADWQTAKVAGGKLHQRQRTATPPRLASLAGRGQRHYAEHIRGG